MKLAATGTILAAFPLCLLAQRANDVPRLPGAITDTSFASRLGRSIQGHPIGGNGRGLITPYLLIGPPLPPPPPVFFSGPPVVINQTFVAPPAPYNPPQAPEAAEPPEPPAPVFTGYQAPPVQWEDPAPAPAPPEKPQASVVKPSLYLIALKDGSVQTTVAYWYEDGALQYVGKDWQVHQVALDQLDKRLSQQLNSERGVDFRLPE